MNWKIAFSALAISFFGAAAGAQVLTFECDVRGLESNGFISPKSVYSIDTKNLKARALDAVVYSHQKKPIDAEMRLLGNGKYRLKWKIRNLKNGSVALNLDYSATLDPKKGTLTTWVNVRGYDNNPYGSGKCTAVSGDSLF